MVFVFIVVVVLVVELSTFYQTIKTTCCVCLFVARAAAAALSSSSPSTWPHNPFFRSIDKGDEEEEGWVGRGHQWKHTWGGRRRRGTH